MSLGDNNNVTQRPGHIKVHVPVPVQAQVQIPVLVESNSGMEICISACACCSAMALVTGAIMLIVYSIVGLVTHWEEGVECGVTQYVLTSLILSYCCAGSMAQEDAFVAIAGLLCRGLIFMSIGIWGMVEIINSVDCVVYDTTLWWSGLFMAIVDMLLFIVMAVIIIIATTRTPMPIVLPMPK